MTIVSCLAGRRLAEERVETLEYTEGSFRLILYGGGHKKDINTVAVLDPEGDAYEITPYAPDFAYAVRRNLSLQAAEHEALHFVYSVWSSGEVIKRKIEGPGGQTVGYEIRPLHHMPLGVGHGDLLDVDYYLLEGGLVRMVVRPRHGQRMTDEETGPFYP